MIGIRCDGRHDEGRRAARPQIDEVDYVVLTAGTFDVIVEVVCEDDDDLLELLNTEIRAMPGRASTETLRLSETRQTDNTIGEPDDHSPQYVTETGDDLGRQGRRATSGCTSPGTRPTSRASTSPIITRGEGVHIWDDAAASATSTGCPGCSSCRSATAATSSPRPPPSRPQSWRSSRCGPTPTPPAIELAERLAALRARRPQPGLLHHRRRRGRRDRRGSWPSSTSS